MKLNWGIGARVVLAAVLPMLVVALLLTTFYTGAQLKDIEEAHVARARAFARQLGAASEYAVFSGNREALQQLTGATVAEDGIVAISVRDSDGELLAHTHTPEAVNLPAFKGLETRPQVYRYGELMRVIEPIAPAALALDDTFSPAVASGTQRLEQPLGNVVVDFSTLPIRRKHQELRRQGFFVVGMVLVGTLLLALLMSRSVSVPIRDVARTVKRVGQGRFNERVPIMGGGSLRTLAEGVNQMARELATTHADLNQRIAAATAELRARKDEAEQANVAKTRFLAAASHDLRQPMHALGLFIAELAQHDLPPAPRRLVSQIDASATAMADLLDSLLDISRLDAGVVQPRPRPIALQPVFDHVLAAQAPEARARGVRLRIRPTDAWTRSDPVLLERILGNLVCNAVRYAPDGNVLVACRRRRGRLSVEIRDNGIGIPKASQAIIFREFVQLHNPERAREKGLGLGLAIVIRLAEMLDHTIRLDSAPGQGSVFYCELPDLSGEVVEVAEEATRQPGDLEGVHVAIIDDDPLALRSMESLLRSWGCKVTADRDLDRVFAALKRTPRSPRVVICDLRLAGPYNGVEAIRRLRARFDASLPAALVTGDTGPDTLALAQEAGLPLMHKPLRPARLRAFLNRVTAGQR